MRPVEFLERQLSSMITLCILAAIAGFVALGMADGYQIATRFFVAAAVLAALTALNAIAIVRASRRRRR